MSREGGSLDREKLRSLIEWHREYRPEWDETPGEYADHRLVGWGMSRRLGLLRLGRLKAYLGVQHVDPGKPGWEFVGEAQTRFFVSLFVSGRCVTLRTFPGMEQALDALASFLLQHRPS
jgi:hypothetical protein